MLQTRARVARAGPGPRIFLNSIPKAGTHLLMQALDALVDVRYSGLHLATKDLTRGESRLVESDGDLDWTRLETMLSKRVKEGQYVTAHIWGYPEMLSILSRLGYASLFMVRDPRDMVVSRAAYILGLSRHPHHQYFVGLGSDQERYLAVIRGFPRTPDTPGSVSLKERLEGFAPWLSDSAVTTCRFEELIGPSGGGTTAQQVATLLAVGERIGVPLSPDAAEDWADRVWSPSSPTFRSGKVGQWADRLSAKTLAVFDESISDELLARYGYER